MSASTPSRLDTPQEEPLFTLTSQDDAQMEAAYDLAARTVPLFKSHVQREGGHVCCAKLRFRDPDLSAQLGEDRFCFLWLANVGFDEKEGMFFGAFFEVPPELEKWHQVGQWLAFDGEDMFDWMVQDDGHIHGAFTMRVTRNKLDESERADYDRYVGAEVWEPLPVV